MFAGWTTDEVTALMKNLRGVKGGRDGLSDLAWRSYARQVYAPRNVAYPFCDFVPSVEMADFTEVGDPEEAVGLTLLGMFGTAPTPRDEVDAQARNLLARGYTLVRPESDGTP